MKTKYSPIILDYLTITLGVCIYALTLAFCIIPYKLATGGAAGIGLLVYYATGIEVQNTYLAINIILLVAAIIELGWKFLAKTIYAIASRDVAVSMALLDTLSAMSPAENLPTSIRNQYVAATKPATAVALASPVPPPAAVVSEI